MSTYTRMHQTGRQRSSSESSVKSGTLGDMIDEERKNETKKHGTLKKILRVSKKHIKPFPLMNEENEHNSSKGYNIFMKK